MAANERVDVVVVGAGISGLSAAHVLVSAGLTVRVLEARDRVGGRTLTVKDPRHGNVDLGGAYIGPTQNRMFRLVRELGLQCYDVNEKEKSVLSLKGVWKCFRGTVPPFWNPLAVFDLNHMVRSLDKMAEQVPVASPWTADCARRWDTMTVKEFIDQTAWFSCTQELMTIVVQSVLTSEPHEVSLLYWLWYVRSGQGLMRLTSITNGAQEKKIVGGSQQVAERLADSLPPSSVKLSTPVVLISQPNHQVEITTDTGTVHTAGHVICAVPPPMLTKIRFHPTLPGVRAQLLQRCPMGSIIKTVMFYDKPFWRELDMCGSAISSEGPVGYAMDDTKHDGSHPAIMGFILADKSRQLANLSSEQRQTILCEHYARTFKCDQFLKPAGYLEKDWLEDEWSGGCYVSSLPPGVVTSYARYMRDPLGRVYFAGTETATEWAGYMDGAVQAGERAAREVLHKLGKLNANEIWQTERESSDFPPLPFNQSIVESVLPSVGRFFYFLLAVFIVVVALLLYHR